MGIIFLMMIDCESCTMKDLACSDCVVSVFVSITSRENVTPAAVQAIETLANSGFVPPLRFHG